MRFDTVLIDIDDTLFDFRKSSYQALVKPLQNAMEWRDGGVMPFTG